MKKIILSIYFLFPLFLFAQETRVLNGQYNDGQSFGKPIPDTVRTLIAGTNVTITSGGASLVDTISTGGGTPAGVAGYIQYNNFGSFGASSNLFWDNTNNRLGINTNAPVHALDVQGTTGNTIVGVGDNFGTAPLIYLQADATNGITAFNSRRNYPFTILVNNTEYIRVLTNGNTGFGLTSPTAVVHIKAGTSAAGTAPFKLTSGTNLTTAEAGAMEYNGTNLFFTPSSSVRNSILMSASVNTVSPTAPNRTITVVINGTTYYIAAKTTND